MNIETRVAKVESRLSVQETHYTHIMSGIDELKELQADNNDDHKGLMNALTSLGDRMTRTEEKTSQQEKKISDVQGRVELVEGKVNIHDSALSSVSTEQGIRGKWQDKALSEFIRLGLTGGAAAAILKMLAVLKVAV